MVENNNAKGNGQDLGRRHPSSAGSSILLASDSLDFNVGPCYNPKQSDRYYLLFVHFIFLSSRHFSVLSFDLFDKQ